MIIVYFKQESISMEALYKNLKAGLMKFFTPSSEISKLDLISFLTFCHNWTKWCLANKPINFKLQPMFLSDS